MTTRSDSAVTSDAPVASAVPAIEIIGVSRRFGPTQALRDVSMTIPRGASRALLGRNGAGKSTLVSLLTGIDVPDAGEIRVAGEVATGQDDRIGCVYQRSSLIMGLSAAENVLLRDYPRRRGGLIDWRALRERARAELDRWGLGDRADVPVSELDPVHRKAVEICRALVVEPEVLILDEPTAGLDKRDAERLFALLGGLRERGVTLIYISHHLDEVYRVCDSVTVMRDARHVVTSSLAAMPIDDLVAAMVGPDAPAEVAERAREVEVDGDVLVAARGVAVPGGVGPVDLEIRRHECVGIAGLEGSGKADFARALAGLLPRDGTLTVSGREVAPGSVPAALAAGVGFVPEDRHHDGMVAALDVSENATMTAAARLGRRLAAGLPRVLRRAQRDELYQGLAETWQIKASSPRQTIAELSGGNQQKCVMARALATQPDLLVLVNPTAGIDVSAKASIVGTLGHVLDDGASVLVVSEDPDDFVLCDRVLVMFKGRISTELQSGWSEQELVAAMQGAEQ